MKKIALAVLIIFAATLTAACSAPAPKVSHVYKFGYSSSRQDNLLEEYTYTVKSDDTLNESFNPPFILSGEGTYTVRIFKEDEAYLFRLETDFSFTGRYLFPVTNTYSDEFTDTFTAVSTAYIMGESLTPVSTVKTFETSIPEKFNYKKAYYTINTEYQKTNNTIRVTSTVTDEENRPDAYKIETDANKNYTAELKERIVDNEFIFLAIRLQPLTVTFTDKFKVPAVLDGIMQTISFNASQNKEVKTFKDPAKQDKDYDCIVISATLGGKYSGRNIIMYFTEVYPVDYLNGSDTISSNVSLLLEIKQENLIFTLTDYQNFAEKPTQES